MGSVNVNRNVSDVFYRYKMPRIIAKVEGKGNGIKTVIVNMTDVAKALGRPPTYPTKFFGCELGAQTQFDFKNDRFIVNGAHDAGKLQQMLDGFIRKFVLCFNCDNPETVLNVNSKKGVIGATCKACGHVGQLDMRHKLTTFILKNPPDVNPAAQGASLTEGKKAKRGKKGEDGSSTLNDGSDNETSMMDNDANGDGDDADDDDWAVDVSEAAVKARQEDLTSGVKSLTITEDLEKTPKERADLFYAFVKARRDQGALGKAGMDREIVQEAERLDVKDKAPLILAELLFDQNILNQLKTYRVILLRFTHGNTKAQKALLGGVELIIEQFQAALLPKVPLILKVLYDSDIVEEEILIEWAEKPSRKYVSKELSTDIHNKAQPFIKWLKEAEEEESSDEEEDSDEDLEIQYDDRARPATLKEQQQMTPVSQTPAKTKKADVEEAEDLDIDAI